MRGETDSNASNLRKKFPSRCAPAWPPQYRGASDVPDYLLFNAGAYHQRRQGIQEWRIILCYRLDWESGIASAELKHRLGVELAQSRG